MQLEGSLPCSQEPSSGPYPKPHQSKPYHPRARCHGLENHKMDTRTFILYIEEHSFTVSCVPQVRSPSTEYYYFRGILKKVPIIVAWTVFARFILCLCCSCCSHLEDRVSVIHFVSFKFHNLRQSVGTPWTSGQPLARPLPTHRYPCLELGFEPTIPVSEQAKTIHALDRQHTYQAAGNRKLWSMSDMDRRIPHGRGAWFNCFQDSHVSRYFCSIYFIWVLFIPPIAIADGWSSMDEACAHEFERSKMIRNTSVSCQQTFRGPTTAVSLCSLNIILTSLCAHCSDILGLCCFYLISKCPCALTDTTLV
jgi:hypothetical protein